MCFLNLLAVIGGERSDAKMADTGSVRHARGRPSATSAGADRICGPGRTRASGGQVGTTGCHAREDPTSCWLILKGYQREHTLDTLRRAPPRGARTPTPAGAGPTERRARRRADDDPSPGEEPSPEQIEEMLRSRAELAQRPGGRHHRQPRRRAVAARGAAPHARPRPRGPARPPRLDEAGLAIDALGALVDGLGDRLAPHDETLRDALSQLRLAYVQVAATAVAASRPSDG